MGVWGKYKADVIQSKQKQLEELEGINDDTINHIMFDSLHPGICMNDGCDYTTQIEPDQDRGHCELCRTKTVASWGCLAGVM